MVVAVSSKTYFCSGLIAGITGSNPADEMDVRLLFFVCCVGSGF